MLKKTKFVYIYLSLFIIFIINNSSNLCFSETEEKKSSPLISNIFIETDLRQALRDIAAQANVVIICDDTVKGAISVELKDVKLEEALEMVLSAGGYVYKKIKNYYLVGYPNIDNPSFMLLSEVESIILNYRRVEEVLRLLPRNFLHYIQADTTSNTLTITAPRQIINHIKENIAHIDKRVPQIMIEARVIELSKEARQQLGIDHSGILWTDKITLSGKGKKTAELNYIITGEAQIRSLFNILDVLIKEGKTEIKAYPRILTLNGHNANIYAGKEKYVPLTTGRPGYEYTRLEKISAGINLDITPYAAVDTGEITLEIKPQVSEIIGEGLEGYPIISNRSAKTIVRLKNDQTIIIGGLIHTRTATKEIGVPILKKIPLLKWIFSYRYKTTEETEVLIFITPHILPN